VYMIAAEEHSDPVKVTIHADPVGGPLGGRDSAETQGYQQ
jgi:hypothetical protein